MPFYFPLERLYGRKISTIHTNSRKKIKNITSNIEVNAINNEKYVVQGKKGQPDRIGPKSSLNYTQPVHTPYIIVYRGAYS